MCAYFLWNFPRVSEQHCSILWKVSDETYLLLTGSEQWLILTYHDCFFFHIKPKTIDGHDTWRALQLDRTFEYWLNKEPGSTFSFSHLSSLMLKHHLNMPNLTQFKRSEIKVLSITMCYKLAIMWVSLRLDIFNKSWTDILHFQINKH